jgi:cytochrome b561
MLKNSEEHYGVIAKSFHWIMAILIIGQLSLGLYMTGMPKGDLKKEFIGLHKGVGVLILFLVIARVLWRFMNILPSLPITIKRWEQTVARFFHGLLYALMFLLPLSGWLMSSAGGYEVSFFGLFTLPSLISPNKALGNFFGDAHTYLGYTLIAVIVLHVLAALHHYFIRKNDVLRRMLF